MRTVGMITVLLLVGLLTSTQAQPVLFAGYDEFCGVPVVVRPNSQVATAELDSFGRPVIHIDPGAMANWTTSRVFVLAHECAHHRLGHITPGGLWARNTLFWATRTQELEADCWAARALASVGYRQDLERAYIDFAYQGGIPPGNYPSGLERSQTVARCIAPGGGRRQDRTGWRAQLRQQLQQFSRARRAIGEDYGRNSRCYRALSRLVIYVEGLLGDNREPDRSDAQHINDLTARVEDGCPQIYGR